MPGFFLGDHSRAGSTVIVPCLTFVDKPSHQYQHEVSLERLAVARAEPGPNLPVLVLVGGPRVLLPALYLLSLLINSTEDDMMWYASGSFAKGHITLSSMVTGIVFSGLSELV